MHAARDHRLIRLVRTFLSLQTDLWKKQMPLEATATQVSLMVKYLQRLRIKRSTTEGEDAPLFHPWRSLDKGSVLMAFPCQHLVSKLVLFISLPSSGRKPAYRHWKNGCSLQRDCLSGWVQQRWQQDTRTSCWRRVEVGSCKQGGQKNGIGDVLRYNKITKPYIFEQSSRQSSLLGSKRE